MTYFDPDRTVSSITINATRFDDVKPEELFATRKFCRECNSWMNLTFEQPMQTIIGALDNLERGQVLRLDKSDQLALAAWAWKTSLTVDAARHDQIVRPGLRSLRNRPTPPRSASIVVGALAAPYLAHHSQRLSTAGPHGFWSALAASHLWFHIVADLGEVSAFFHAKLWPTKLGVQCHRIWPSTPGMLELPPPEPLTPGGFNHLINGLAARQVFTDFAD